MKASRFRSKDPTVVRTLKIIILQAEPWNFSPRFLRIKMYKDGKSENR